MPDYLVRPAALLSAFFPVIWLGLLLVYASRRRITAEAANVAFIAGFLSALTVGISFLTISTVAAGNSVIGLKGVLAISFLAAALPEEAAKLAVLLTIVYRHEDVHSPLDYVLAAGWVGLGFAGLENLFYIFGQLTDENNRWLSVAIARAATAVPSHTISGVLMGLLLARGFDDKSNKTKWIAAAFFLPFLLHGLYDVCVLSLRKEFAGFLTVVERWYLALGMGIVMAVEAWLAGYLLRRWWLGLSGHTIMPPLGGWSRWTDYSFKILIILTILISLVLIGFGALGIRKGHVASGFAGAGIAWLGIIYVILLLRRPVKVNHSDLTASPQVPISKDLASG